MRHDLRRSVARVVTAKDADSGTAFFVYPGGLALTCAHIAEKAVRDDGTVVLELFGPGDFNIEAPALQRLRAVYERSEVGGKADVALLRVIGELPEWSQLLRISNLSSHDGVDAIESYGFPKNRQTYGNAASGTIIGADFDGRNHQPALQIRSEELTGGYSGAPIVDKRTGHVVGMMKATLNPDPRGKFEFHAWAVPAAIICAVAPEVQREHHPIVAELLRISNKRIPTVLDYALDVTDFVPSIPPMLIPDRDDGGDSRTVEAFLKETTERGVSLVLVVGEAGSGKSSLLRGWLTRVSGEHASDDFVPLYVRATSFAVAAGGDMVDRLWSALSEDRIASIPKTYAAADLRALIDGGQPRFLILIDGLDEVTDAMRRVETARDLGELARTAVERGHRAIVASRPVLELKVLENAGILVERWRMAAIDADRRHEFFSNFLGPDAIELNARFRQYDGTRVGTLPLLLALSAVVYKERGTLPTSVTELLGDYVQLATQRAARRSGLERSDPNSLEFLPSIALKSLDLPELNAVAIRSIVQGRMAAAAPHWPTIALRSAVEAVVEAIASDQIVLYREGEHFRWIHLSLRDFLAGQCLADRLRSGESMKTSWPKWRDSGAREAVLFGLVIASEWQDGNGQNVETALQSMLGVDQDAPPDEEALRFAIDAIRMGLRLSPDALDRIVDATLFVGLEVIGEFESCRRLMTFQPHPLELLVQICSAVPSAADKLFDLISRKDLSTDTRQRIARKLGRWFESEPDHLLENSQTGGPQ